MLSGPQKPHISHMLQQKHNLGMPQGGPHSRTACSKLWDALASLHNLSHITACLLSSVSLGSLVHIEGSGADTRLSDNT